MGSSDTADDGVTASAELWDVVAAVPDPEMPPLTIADLGILRQVEIDDVGSAAGEDADEAMVTVRVTPTYSGCPAVEYIEDQIVEAVVGAGYDRTRVRIDRVFSPPWSTDWITDEGRAKLAASGISPPRPVAVAEPGTTAVAINPSEADRARIGTVQAGPVEPRGRAIACPRCGSVNTEQVSRFGSTACKALHRCLDCAEPFDHVKEL